MWTTDGDTYAISLPLTKIDKKNRLVSGWASLDNLDLQGDIVLAEASKSAFANFRGNIREMHQPIAVGRMIDWRPDSYYDTVTQKFYSGIYVTVYVSKGAESTWEKVLDGTLQAFSIKGPITESDMEFSKDVGHPIRIVKGYELEELSLVDAGGNQLCNIASIQKGVDGVVVKGLLAETVVENIFYCDGCGVAKTSTEDSARCPEDNAMQNIGWVEQNDVEKAARILGAIEKMKNPNNGESAEAENATEDIIKVITSTLEGGNNMADNSEVVKDVVAEVEEVEAVATTEEAETVADEASEVEAVADEAAEVSEVEAEEPDLAKMFGDLQAAIENGLAKSREEAAEGLEKAVAAMDEKFSQLLGKHEELTKEVAAIKDHTSDVEKTLKAVEADTAVKKSGDLGGSQEETLEKVNKGPSWGGSFLNLSDLNN